MSASHTGKYESGDPWSHTGRVSSRASGDRNRPLSERDFRMWLSEHRAVAGSVADVRIDVVGVLRPSHGPAGIEHLVSVAV